MSLNIKTHDVNDDFDISRTKLNDEKKYPWFSKNYKEYVPVPEEIAKLKKLRKHLTFVVYAGSWCDDTHVWLPKFYKVVETTGIKPVNIKLFGVDEDKKPVRQMQISTGINSDGKIDIVPVFYVYYKGKEMGKISESPRKNLEADLVELLKPIIEKR